MSENPIQVRWQHVEDEYRKVIEVIRSAKQKSPDLPTRDAVLLELEEFILRALITIALCGESPNDPLLPLRYTEEKRFLKRCSSKRLGLLLKVADLVHKALRENVHITKRDVYYAGVSFFQKQAASDAALEKLAAVLQVPRNSLHVVAAERGAAIGNLRYTVNGAVVDLMHSSGAGVPIDPQFTSKVTALQTNARYILLIEKDATFLRLIDDKFHLRHPCIMVTGRGYPDLGTRLFVRKLRDTFGLPIFGLVDWDPSGVEILCTYMDGGERRGFDETLAVSTIRWLGIHSSDLQQHAIPSDTLIQLTERDRKKCNALLKRDLLRGLPMWRMELEQMLLCGVKAEIQALCARGLAFLADEFLPKKIQEGKWM